MTLATRIRTTFLALAALAASVPAQAQLDPRLQVVTTDLIQVYQSTPANPELLTCYDFSGSMHAVYWTKQYYTNPNEDTHNAQWAPNPGSINYDASYYGAIPNNGDFPGLVPVVSSKGKIYLAYGTGYKDNVNTYSDSVTGRTRILWPQNITNPLSKDATTGLAFTAGSLVSPDGNLINPTGNSQNDVMKASHIRITASYIDAALVKHSRTIDLPIPWMVMDTTYTGSNAESSRVTIPDTIGGGPAVEPDTISDPNNVNKNNPSAAGNLINTSISDAGSGDTYQKIGRFHYNLDYLWWVFFGTDTRNATNDGTTDTGSPVIPDITTAKAWKNGIAGMTRYQALKYATIYAWFANQKKVWWGARFLDGSEEQLNTVSAQNGNASGTQADRNINLFRPASNSSSANGSVLQFTTFEPSTSTPLTYAFANSYTQLAYTSNSGSAFGTANAGHTGQNGTENPIPKCRKSFFVVFTDGYANDGYKSSGDGTAIGDLDPYGTGSSLTSTNGNGNVKLTGLPALNPSYASSNSGHSMFNIWTLAGIAAHYPPPAATLPSSGSSSYTVSSVAPFDITARPSGVDRRIRTMTVAMSVGGSTFSTYSPVVDAKKALYLAALYGNPDNDTWSKSDLPFVPPTDPGSNSTNNNSKTNPFFFDATDPVGLSSAMTAILAEVTSASGSISAPASPLVGLTLGNQAYLGLFQTAQNTPRWQGDLLMAGLAITSDGTFFIDKDYNVVSSLNGQSAAWSANSQVFLAPSGRHWYYISGSSDSRNIYTNYNTSTSSSKTTTLVPLDESALPVSTTPGIVGAPDATTAKAYLRFMRGASTAGETAATETSVATPRSDIFGDIINSSPVVLEYPLSVIKGSGSSISQRLSDFAGSIPSGSDGHFRLIFVGDNQGIFHAFAEVSYAVTHTVTRTIVTGTDSSGNPITTTKTYTASVVTPATSAVDEIWAFFPGEYLKYISYYRNTANIHRYGMDGTATVYLNDTNGDGMVDNGETVRVVIGQRKGGRSFYAFDFSDISNIANNGVKMAWKLAPDDIAATDYSGQGAILQRMGFSSSTPAVARVEVNATTHATQDLLFIGGGLSTATLDTSLSGTYGANTKFGRSLIAFDVVNGPGTPFYAWDFTNSSFTSKFGSMGCIPAAVVPTYLDPKSTKAWRVYFADTPTDSNSNGLRGAGVWALGSTYLFQTTDGASVPNVIRKDSQNINDWTGAAGAGTFSTQGIRHVFQTPTGYSITTVPGVFLLGTNSVYPSNRTAAPQTAPATTVLVFGTGDRNDPTDQDGINPGSTNQNYMDLVFDRSDSASLSGVANVTGNVDVNGISQSTGLADLTTVSSFTDTNIVGVPYYLTQYLGYKLGMGAATAQATSGQFYYPKVITSATVQQGVLFFSDFLPGQGTGTACTGSGKTNTYRICDVLRPIFNSGNTVASATSFNSGNVNCSGIVLSFPNLPGEITNLGGGIIQTGQGTSSTGNNGDSTINNTGANVGSGAGKGNSRVFSPRSWRVIR